MPLGLTVLVGVYSTLRVLEYQQKRRQKNLLKVTPTPSDSIPQKKSQSLSYKIRNINLTKRSSKADLNLSLAGVGLAVLQPLILPGWSFLNAFLIGYSAYPYMRGFEQSILNKKISNDVLGAAWIILATSGNQYFAASLGNVVYHLGTNFIEKNRQSSRDSMVHIFDRENRQAWVLKEGVEIAIPLTQVMAGDSVIIRSGDMIPVDGTIIQGTARIDQHVLTGESQAVEKSVNDQVFASTLLISGQIYVLVEKAGNDTVVAKIETTLAHTTDFKSTLQMKGEEWADKAAPYLLGFAGITALVAGPASGAAVLNAQIGYQLRMVAPLSTLRYLSKATHDSILVKDGRSLETLNTIDTFLFDKTGTLTEEQPHVGQVVIWGNYTEEQVLRLAAIAEFKLTHPVAKAILQAYARYEHPLPELDNSHYEMGFGTKVSWEGQMIRVGSLRFMQNEGLSLGDNTQIELEPIYAQGHSVVVVGVDENIIGAIEIKPTIRSEIPALIATLKQRGKHVAIVSGDHDKPTQRLAQQLGIEEYFAEVLPEDKANIVDLLKQQGRKVCFVGDGINDTIAMKKAHVSISLQGASSIATDTADILLMSGDLKPLVKLLDIAQSLQTTMYRSAWLVAIPSTVVLSSSLLLHTGLLFAILVKNTFLSSNVFYVLQKSKPQPEKVLPDTTKL